MAGFYEQIRTGTAYPLIKEYGAPVLLKSLDVGALNPVSGVKEQLGSFEYPGYAIAEDYTLKEIDGSSILRGDQKLTAIFDDPSAIPRPGFTILRNGVVWEIKDVKPLAPGGEIILYMIQVRV